MHIYSKYCINKRKGDPIPSYPISSLNMIKPMHHLPNFKPIARDEKFRYIDNYVHHSVYPERYMISNYGRVFDRKRNMLLKFIMENTNRYGIAIAYQLDINRWGYTNVPVDRAVMIVHNGIIHNYQNLYIKHINGDLLDNRASNLQWESRSRGQQVSGNISMNRYSAKNIADLHKPKRADLDNRFVPYMY